jgi:hypothetical protein
MRRALAWFFGPKQPASKRERWLMIFLALVGLVLMVLGGFDSWLNTFGVALFGSCTGVAVANVGFRGRPREPSQRHEPSQ